jgi:hypothetical protein
VLFIIIISEGSTRKPLAGPRRPALILLLPQPLFNLTQLIVGHDLSSLALAIRKVRNNALTEYPAARKFAAAALVFASTFIVVL